MSNLLSYKLGALGLLLAVSASAADISSTITFKITHRSAVVCYTVGAGNAGTVGTIELSQSPSYTPVVDDVNTTLFTGSASDNRTGSTGAGTQNRCVVLGQGGTGIEYAPVANDGKRHSRALQANTTHYFRVTVGTDSGTASMKTQNLLTGDQYPGAYWPVDPATPGTTAWPTVDPTSLNTCYIHPVTGLCFQQFLRPDFNTGTAVDNNFHHVYQGTGWTNPTNMLADDGSLAVTSNTNPVVVTTDTWDLTGANNGQSLVGITLEVKGYVADACSAGDDRKIVIDGIVRDGVNAWSSSIEATLPTQTAYGAGTTTNIGDDSTHPNAYLQAWFTGGTLIQPVVQRQMLTILNDLNPRFGNYDRSGNNLTLSYPGSAENGLQWESFSTDWVSGSHIFLDTGATPADTTISSVTSATQVTVAAGSGATTNAQFIAPNFGFKLHKKTANCSMSLDYVHFQKTYYSTPQLNGGSSNSHQTPYTKYPEGEVVTGATNASPIVLTLNSGVTAHHFAAGNVIHCFGVQGNTAANGNFTIASTTTFTVTLTGTTGNGTFSGNGACYTTTPAARKGYFFMGTSNGNAAQLMWINTDQIPAEVRYLGIARFTQGGWATDIMSGANYSIDDSSADSPGFYNLECTSGSPCGANKQHVWHGVYIGNPSLGLMADVGGLANTNLTDQDASWRWTDQTPTTTLTDQLTAFDATYTGTMAWEMSAIGLLNSTTLVIRGQKGPQNSACWTGVWDTNTKTVIGLVNSWTSPNMRWKGCHGTNLMWGAAYLGGAGYPLNDPSSQYSGPYTSVLQDNGLNNTTPQDCVTLLNGIGQANPWGITGNNCSKTTLSSITPVSQGLPASHTFGPLIVGDLADMWTSGNADDGETIRILGISGTTIVVQRALWANHPIASHPIGAKFWWRENPPKAAIAVDSRGAFYSDTWWWDYVNDPHGTNTNDPYQQQTSNATVTMENLFTEASHIGGAAQSFISDSGPNGVAYVGTCTAQSQNRFGGIRHGIYSATTATCYNANPAFDGSAGGGVGAASMETHLGFLIPNGTQVDRAFADSRVYQASEGWQLTLAKVGGLTNWYLATAYNEFGNTYDYKRQKVNVWIGTKIGHDVSSPTYDISTHDTSADAYNYCRAYKVNDCFTGSAANNVYVNIPKFALPPDNWPYGSGTYRCLGYTPVMAHDADDLCVSIEPILADELMQYASSTTVSDPKGTGQRRLGVPFSLPKELNGTNLTQNMLPDGSAIVSQMNYLVNLPAFSWDNSVDRTTWLPVSVASGTVPANTTQAYVQFGYNPSYFCSDRQEICVANAASVQAGNSVYSFKTSDSPTALACATSCNIVVPALAERVMWYQWQFFNAMGASTGSGPVTITTTDTATQPSVSSLISGKVVISGKTVVH